MGSLIPQVNHEGTKMLLLSFTQIELVSGVQKWEK
jgi:hypothetical protein